MKSPILAKSPACAGISVGILAMLAAILTLTGISLAQTEDVRYSFTGGNDGDGPQSSLILDSAGNLYGTTTFGGPTNTRYCGGNGCGVVFELSPNASGWTYTVLYAFTGGVDGGEPYGSLTLDSTGNLYGTTSLGGKSAYCSNGCGVVFELARNGSDGWTETILHTFHQLDGAVPQAGVIFDNSGNLYGTTYFGGTLGNGVVFKLSPDGAGGWKESVLHMFTLGADGGWPNSLIMDASGNLYGTTYYGGYNLGRCTSYGCGVVFRLVSTTAGWKERVLYTFRGLGDGGNPSGLAVDALGNLYGTTLNGGDRHCNTYGCGTVFKLTHSTSGWTRSLLHAFAGGSDGAFTSAGPTLDSRGNIFGATENGGTAGTGVLFELSFSGGVWDETILHTFTNGTDGGYPFSGVVLDGSGNIFGQTNSGGIPGDCSAVAGCGVVYEVTP